MSEQPERPKHLELRASDADRERVAKILHDAMGEGRLTLAELDERLQTVYQAKTLGDLVPVTQDLPAAATTAVPGPAIKPMPGQALAQRVTGDKGPVGSFAIMSGVDRKGDWALSKHHNVVAIMGGVELNLTQATFEDQECTIQVFTMMGGVSITVPEDVTVRCSGFGFMGAFDDRVNRQSPNPGGPILNITGLAFMGGVEIKRPKLSRRERKQLED